VPLLSILFESAVRVTLIAGTVALILRATRIESPAVRHALWTGVVITMLLLPVVVAWMPEASVPILPPVAPESERLMWVQSTDRTNAAEAPALGSIATDIAAESVAPTWRTYATGAYLVGLCWFLIRLGVGSLYVRKLVRTAILEQDRLTHPICATPITVGWLKPTIVLPARWWQWPPDQLDAILLHEHEHVRRRDPLVQWVALLNRAVFWFHPLAWWLDRQLSTLAEEVCDEAVLARGYDRRRYSECLLGLAHAAARAGGRVTAIGMAISGASLPRRIHQILDWTQPRHVPRMRLASTVVLCAFAGATLAAGRLAPATQPAATSNAQHAQPRSMTQRTESASRGFAIHTDGHLRAHGFISDDDRVQAQKLARAPDYGWLRDGGDLYVITDPDLVKQAFDLYEHADACSAVPSSSTANPLRRRAGCNVSDAEIEAARDAPDLVLGLAPAKKVLMRRVWMFLEAAAKGGRATRIHRE
jgi:beta-lactamase regulating signal transducer with metallopeptidase domain